MKWPMVKQCTKSGLVNWRGSTVHLEGIATRERMVIIRYMTGSDSFLVKLDELAPMDRERIENFIRTKDV